MAYIISHDLQEPVRMINSYIKLLEKKYKNVLDNEAIEYINYAVDGATRLKTMIDDLLRYSRLRKENTNKTRFNMADISDAVIKNLKTKYKEYDLKIDNSLKSPPEIYGDINQISQLFLNLIENAVKFNLNPVREVFVNQINENGYINVCIKDNGPGIDKQYHERIFGIFQKLHNRTEFPGSGIGLAICKKIIENHNGRIWIESETGKGTNIYFSIPIVT